MFEYLVGLQVTDDELYGRYREVMYPILRARGGDFGYDFRVAEMLKGESDRPINRVFTIRFPDEGTAREFFEDPEYLEAKAQYFEPSVEHTTIIAGYAR